MHKINDACVSKHLVQAQDSGLLTIFFSCENLCNRVVNNFRNDYNYKNTTASHSTTPNTGHV